MMKTFFRFRLAGGLSMESFASGHFFGQLSSWSLLRGSPPPLPGEVQPLAADGVGRSADGSEMKNVLLLHDSGTHSAGNSGPLRVQPEVTHGTIGAVSATSGAAMDSKPDPSLERAFARTEVAGLDELPTPAADAQPLQPSQPAASARPAMVERRGAPLAEPTRAAASTGAPVGLSLFSQQRLDPEAERWLKALPVAVRPVITARRHPHIINKFSRCWGRPELVASYLEELLISNRPGRRGFAMEVLEELSLLQSLVQERRLS